MKQQYFKGVRTEWKFVPGKENPVRVDSPHTVDAWLAAKAAKIDAGVRYRAEQETLDFFYPLRRYFKRELLGKAVGL